MRAPVVLSYTANASLTHCTYCVAPIAPFVSGGAAWGVNPPPLPSPSKLSSAEGVGVGVGVAVGVGVGVGVGVAVGVGVGVAEPPTVMVWVVDEAFRRPEIPLYRA